MTFFEIKLCKKFIGYIVSKIAKFLAAWFPWKIKKSHGEFIYSLTIIGHQEPELRQQNSIPLHETKTGISSSGEESLVL